MEMESGARFLAFSILIPAQDFPFNLYIISKKMLGYILYVNIPVMTIIEMELVLRT